MDAKEADEVNGIGGVLRLMEDEVARRRLGKKADLVEGGSQPALAQGRPGGVGGGTDWLVMNMCGLVVSGQRWRRSVNQALIRSTASLSR